MACSNIRYGVGVTKEIGMVNLYTQIMYTINMMHLRKK